MKNTQKHTNILMIKVINIPSYTFIESYNIQPYIVLQQSSKNELVFEMVVPTG